MKRLVVLVLAGLIVSTFAFGVGNQGKVEEEARPIWVWGLPSWAGDYSEESLLLANKWAQERFGATFRLSSRPEGITVLQGLNLLMSGGEFPDAIIIGGLDVSTRSLVADLIKEGRLACTDEYFNKPETYPNLWKANKDYFRAYMFDGKLYGFPSMGWNVKKDTTSVYGGSCSWWIRYDIGRDEGGFEAMPTNSDELLALLRRIKAGNYKDLEGRDVIPLGLHPEEDLNYMTALVKESKGAGWQVDDEMRYGPFWASQEIHDSLQFVNTLWREGMLEPGLFTNKYESYREKLFTASFGISAGFVNFAGTYLNPFPTIVQEKGFDDPEVVNLRKYQNGLMLNPIREKDGKMGMVLGQLAGMTLVSEECPDIDALMKLVDFLISDEGVVTNGVNVGLLGVDWEWTDPPYYFKKIGETDPEKYHKEYADFFWKGHATVNAEKAEKNPPPALPLIHYITSPAYTNFYGWTCKMFHMDRAERTMGYVIGKPEDMGFTVVPQFGPWIEAMNAVISPTPSYMFFTKKLDANENSALITIEQRWKEGLPHVIIAENFEQAYSSFLNTLILTANWRPIYEKLQSQWEGWMKSNEDDRDTLHTIEWRPEWKQKMGWK